MECTTTLKNIKRCNDLKEEATQLFKNNKYQDAIDKFNECVGVDALNLNYNSTVYFNIAVAYSKLSKNEDALKTLNKCIKLNPDYTKAYVKRGEVNQALGNHEEALRDF